MCRQLPTEQEEVFQCPMCKVFPSNRCRHIRDICTKRDVHPHCDVEYLKNAEVQTFNGCGFCKWARKHPDIPLEENRGWPGCCRPPEQQQGNLIQAADWPAVSIYYQIPVPSHIKSLLDNAAAYRPALVKSPYPPIQIPRSSTSSKKSSPPSSNSSITTKKRSGSASPRPTVLMPSSLPNGQVTESNSFATRRNNSSDVLSKSPSRRSSELDSPRRPPISRSPSSNNTNVTINTTHNVIKRRSSISASSKTSSPSSANSQSTPRIIADKPFATINGRVSAKQRPPLDQMNGKSPSPPAPAPAPPSAATSSERGRGSDSATSVITESTITSDGGFTDYLSDESDAELQRQAEARAVLAAQNQVEEAEFKAARQQLAAVGLKPPKTWHASGQESTARLVPQPPTAQAGGGGQRD